MKTIRVFFTKTGRAKYISHLDVNRCIDRAIKRSGIPVWYTQGFNPHIYTTFAMPISLGFESLCESFETRLVEDDFSLEEVKTALNRVLPTGLEVTQVAEPVMEMKEIAKADYGVDIRFAGLTAGELAALLEGFHAQDAIMVLKRSKKGMLDVDIKPHFEVLSHREEDSQLHLELRAAAGSTLNINPMLVIGALVEFAGRPHDGYRVIRRQIYNGKGEIFA